jgi:hypothetical protein
MIRCGMLGQRSGKVKPFMNGPAHCAQLTHGEIDFEPILRTSILVEIGGSIA